MTPARHMHRMALFMRETAREAEMPGHLPGLAESLVKAADELERRAANLTDQALET
ncbi:MAG: hypothetical protein WDN08_15000 [Rhizomicrobium sp.]